MMDIRKRIFIAIGILAGLTIAIILWYFWAHQGAIEPDNINSNEQTTADQNNLSNNSNTGLTKLPVKQETNEEVYAKQVARIFVERFATYSNQNDNRHLEDAIAMATVSMAKWLKNQVIPLSNDYQGVTTKVIAERIIGITSEKAKVGVETQQVWESATASETKQRNGTLDLVKVDNEWKVDGFYWEK